MVPSSAKKSSTLTVQCSGRSFTQRMKSNGLKRDSCGTPAFMLFFILQLSREIEDLTRVVILYEIYETSLRRVHKVHLK